jgi:hypothetical protein
VPTYDPWAWILWGREIAHADLVTTGGPSWKPLPILFTTPFSLFGDTAAPALWLVVARAGGILGVALAFRLAARLAGPVAGAIAAVTLLISDEFVRNFARGNSEGLLVAFCLLALERHLDGRRRDAFALIVAAGLLRPEVWPFCALYGLWLLEGAWHGRRPPWRELAVVAGAGLLLIAAWFLPEYIGSGSALRAAARAHHPNPDSPAFAAHPFLEVFVRSRYISTPPVYLGALIAVAYAWRDRRRDPQAPLLLGLAAIATALMVAVALMTQGGFAGNLRYVALPAALVCILAGVGWVALARSAGRRHAWGVALVALAALALWTPYTVQDIRSLDVGMRRVGDEANLYGATLKATIAKAGGRAALTRCGPVFTGPLETQVVAYRLHLHETQVSIFSMPPGTVIGRRGTAVAADPRFAPAAATALWVVRRSCGGG